MDIIFIKDYLTYKIDKVLKKTKKTTAERLISLGVCKEVETKKEKTKENK